MRNRKIKILTFMLLTIIVICMFPSRLILADDNIQLDGEGTLDNPYQIWNKDDFIYLSESVNSGVSYYKQYVQLMNDIDMEDIDMHPIGEYGLGNYFWGTFDGAGHIIKNISIVSENNAGLFGQLGGTVMNLGIESGLISGGRCNGGISSHAASKSALIINCYNKAKVSASYRAGGIADNFSGTILNCWTDCELDAQVIGGIYSYSCSSLKYCYSTQELYPGWYYSGGSNILLTDDRLYSPEMCVTLNDDLSNNLNYDLRSNIDATKLYSWSFSNGNLCFSNQKSCLINKVKYRSLEQYVVYWIVFLSVFALLFIYIKMNIAIQDKNTISLLSSAFIISAFVAFIILNIIYRGSCFNQVLFYGNDTFMDYYNSVYDVANRHPYERGVIYPPLCNVIYYLASRFISQNSFNGIYHFPGGSTIRDIQGVKFSFALYNAFVFLVLLIALRFVLKNLEKNEKAFLSLATICSMPFVYAFERGNIILLSYVFVLLFIVTYGSKNRFIRELGLLSLAIGGVIKIYPAIFGLILIEDKKYKEAIRAVIYGIILFFVPFVFFEGVDGIKQLLSNISRFANSSGSVSLYTYNMNPGGVYSYISELSDLDFANTKWISFLIGIVLCVVSFFESIRWKKVCMLTCSMICIMPNVGTYVMIYLLIPWIILMSDKQYKWRKIDKIMNFLFLIIFAVIPFGLILRTKYIQNSYTVRVSSAVSTISITLLTLILLFDFFITHYSKKKSIICSLLVVISIFVFSIYSFICAKGLPINDRLYVDLSIDNSDEKKQLVVSGLDQCIDGYTWTVKDNVLFNYLETDPDKDYFLILNIHDTYNSVKNTQEIVLYNDKEEIYRGVIQGNSNLSIPFHSDNDKVKLRIELPNAVNPYYIEHVEDRRSLSLQLESIEIIPQN